MEDYLELIKKHNIRVSPNLVDGVWSAGRVHLTFNRMFNMVPKEEQVTGATPEQAVKNLLCKLGLS